MRKILKNATAVLTLAALMVSFTGCAKKDAPQESKQGENPVVTQSEADKPAETNIVTPDENTEAKGMIVNLMEGIKAEPAEAVSVYESGQKLNGFAVKLFNACRVNDENDENTLVSPLSVVLALAMTANGADGETLAQMEKVLGISKDELNGFAYSYMKLLSERNSAFGTLKPANSIWFTSDPRFTVEQPFLQTNAKYYDADIYKAPFDDSTLKAINDWVNEKTDGMIPAILDNIPAEAVMYLVNALAFDAQWAEPYFDYQVNDGVFTTADGKQETKPYLYCQENAYLKDDKASGFIKYYKGYHYAFVALLPDEGVDVDTYLDQLDGAHLNELLGNKQNCKVHTAIPKFKTKYSVEMSKQLKSLGMTSAFDKGTADFKKLGTSTAGNISIDRVIHKTFIAVDENGTKAGAATIVEMKDGATLEREEPKEVYLTRPFVYMLIDCNTNTPFFVGVMRDLDK